LGLAFPDYVINRAIKARTDTLRFSRQRRPRDPVQHRAQLGQIDRLGEIVIEPCRKCAITVVLLAVARLPRRSRAGGNPISVAGHQHLRRMLTQKGIPACAGTTL
jgi:hypothetical protein